MPRKVGSGIYKHWPAPKNHPWRRTILKDVIIASKKTKRQWVNELKEIFKNEKI